MAPMVDPRTALAGRCWPLRLVLLLVIGNAAPAAPPPSAESATLLRALEDIVSEEDAQKVLEPHMESLKTLDATVVEKVVFKQWWTLATAMVARSHLQGVDLSFAVRKAVRAIKDESDELMRRLNPKYGQAQQVAPAFQWAQNDTCIFLTVKFTARWNAPGALGVTEPTVEIVANKFNFTGLGKHSNNKYKYQLGLKLFDNVAPADSTWNAASVGKLSVILRKAWPRKWPRLLMDKKAKIGNMHVWMETQDRLNADLGGMSSVSHSPVTCEQVEKLYCSVTDTCKLPANCEQCPGKTVPVEAEHVCAGVPTQKASLSFRDTDMDRHELGGVIKITKAKHDFETQTFAVYWGKDGATKLDGPGVGNEDAQVAYIGKVSANEGNAQVDLAHNTKKPDQATHLLVFTKNVHGEYDSPGSESLTDAFLPLEAPQGMKFEDEDGDRNEIKGDLKIEKADGEVSYDKFALYWGKSATRKMDTRKNSSNVIAIDITKEQSSHFIAESTKIPEQATHLLLFSKNEHGENPSPVAMQIVDNTSPCQKIDEADCPSGVSVVPNSDSSHTLSVARAREEAGIVAYTMYWGRGGCDEAGSWATNGHIKYFGMDVSPEGALEHQLDAALEVPDGTTHVLAFSQNKLGESKFCVSERFHRSPADSDDKKEDSSDSNPKPEL